MSTIEEELTEKTAQLDRRARTIRKQRAALRKRQRKAREKHLHDLGEILERVAGRPLQAEDAEIAALSLSLGDGKLTHVQIAGALLAVSDMANSSDPEKLNNLANIEAKGRRFLAVAEPGTDN